MLKTQLDSRCHAPSGVRGIVCINLRKEDGSQVVYQPFYGMFEYIRSCMTKFILSINILRIEIDT